MNAQEFRELWAATVAEDVFQAQTVTLAKSLGWKVFHPYDSRRSEKGWPDLSLVHPRQGRVMFRELKTAKGRLTQAQKDWQTDLAAAGVDVDVWRPADSISGRIERELRGGDA